MRQLWRESHYLRNLLLWLAAAMLVFSICRVLFYSINQLLFPPLRTSEMLGLILSGWRFDMVAVAYINLPVIISFLFPIKLRKEKRYQLFQLILFLICNGLALIFELGDMAYFPYSLRRTNAGDFGLMGNTMALLPALLKEHWYLLLLFVALLFMLFYFAKNWNLKSRPPTHKIQTQFLIFLLGMSLTLVAVRGGLQLRPLMPLNASQYVEDMRLAPLVYPTSLSVLFSAQQRFLEEKNYYSDEELERIAPLKQHLPDGLMRKENVCIIVLESFGKEYSQLFTGTKGYTPFLDSLLREGFYCEYSFANGLRSTQGLAAIAAGVPALMDDPLMFSAYQSNQINGIGTVLQKKGYTTAFFHGSNPGSMEFGSFAQACGFQQFYDKTNYPYEEHYDGQWGIWDLPYFQYAANTLDSYQEPFLGLLFSLTSHHPYQVEPFFEKQNPNTPPLNRSILYTDTALKKFFQTASQMDWFDNTLFVITADHTGRSTNPKYQTKLGKYNIPILFHKPNGSLPENKKQVASQIDIIPTLLDYLNYDEAIQTFGSSLLDDNTTSYAYMYANQVYQIVDAQYILLFDEQKTIALYNHQNDRMLTKNIMKDNPEVVKRLEQELKGMIQRHHRGMVRNELGGED